MAGAGLDVVHPVDGMEVEGINRQAVVGVGRHAQNLAGADLLGRVGDQGGLRLLTVNFDDFGTQPYLFRSRGACGAKPYHIAPGNGNRADYHGGAGGAVT